MKWCILGIDGYLGWTLACHLASLGEQVCGVDAFLRRKWVERVGSRSVIPIASMPDRLATFAAAFPDHGPLPFTELDLLAYTKMRDFLKGQEPDVIVHLAEQPSAPYSMIDQEPGAVTITNNIVGTYNVLMGMREVCPEAHLIKIGTMGEYGTPGIPIPEGVFPPLALWEHGTPEGEQVSGCEPVWPSFVGRLSGLQFPRCPGSTYHAAKCMDTVMVEFACRMWGLTSTDIMQGVVYGTSIPAFDDPELRTRFDVDECFGTAINRFVAQAIIDEPITPYGAGHQKRGFLPLIDSMRCITLLGQNPPAAGEYRTVNQLEAVYDITDLALKVRAAGKRAGLSPRIRNWTNPRTEQEEHTYEVIHDKLTALGYEPTRDMDSVLDGMFADLLPHKRRIESVAKLIRPRTRWQSIGPCQEELGPLDGPEEAEAVEA